MRRRISNLTKLTHPLDVLLRIFSFRKSAKVRAHLFAGRYDERALQPVNTAIKDYARLLEMEDDEWVVEPDAPEYKKETGICLSDAGMHAGVLRG